MFQIIPRLWCVSFSREKNYPDCTQEKCLRWEGNTQMVKCHRESCVRDIKTFCSSTKWYTKNSGTGEQEGI